MAEEDGPGLLDILLIDSPAELILKQSGQNAACTLAETSRAAAKSCRPFTAAFRALPRQRGHARIFILHNERPSEKERDHYALWRAGWEPQLGETELKTWFPREPLPRSYVRAQRRMCDLDSDAQDHEAAEEEARPAQWGCPRCTLLNPRTQPACGACGAVCPGDDTVDGADDTDATAAGGPQAESPASDTDARERAYTLAEFARWRGCNTQDFAGIHHGDLVIDEGQYRGHGTFVAVWSSELHDADAGDGGQLMLTPAVGLDGVMLPKSAWGVIQTHGPQYYERAGYGSWLYGEILASEQELAEHEQFVRDSEQAAAVAAAAGEQDAHDRRLRERGAGMNAEGEMTAADVPLPDGGSGCDRVYYELRPATRFTRHAAPHPSDHRLARDSIKGDRPTAGAAGEPVWSKLPPHAFTAEELSSSSDLRWRQQQPITSLMPPPPALAAAASQRPLSPPSDTGAAGPSLWGQEYADTHSCGNGVLSEDMAYSHFDSAAGGDGGGLEPVGGVLTDDMAYMMIAPSQHPVAAPGTDTRRDAAAGTPTGGGQGDSGFVHDGMARLYNNHWQNRTTGEQDAAVAHDQWTPAFVPAPTPLPTTDKRQTRTYKSHDTVRPTAHVPSG